MELVTSRFGAVHFEAAEVIVFDQGLAGHSSARQWLLLADSAHPELYWLQSISMSEVALPVICPWSLDANYKITIDGVTSRRLRLNAEATPLVLVRVDQEGESLTVRTDIPIVVNSETRRGQQTHLEGVQPIQWETSDQSETLKQSA